MLGHIRNLAISSVTTLPLAVAAICLICILFTMIVLHTSHEQMRI
jgi:hypothetical protein